VGGVMGSGGPFVDPPPPPGWGAPGQPGSGSGFPPPGGGAPGFPPPYGGGGGGGGQGFPPPYGGGGPPGFPPAGGGSSFPPGSFGPPPEGGGRSRWSGCGLGCLVGILVLLGVAGTIGFYAWKSWDTVSGWWEDANDAADLANEARDLADDLADGEGIGEEFTASVDAPGLVEGDGGVTFEVFAVEVATAADGTSPGTAAADVEVCLEDDSPFVTVSSASFVFVTAPADDLGDGTDRDADVIGDRQPAFSVVSSGACGRGWVTVAVPAGAVPTSVAFEETFLNPDGVPQPVNVRLDALLEADDLTAVAPILSEYTGSVALGMSLGVPGPADAVLPQPATFDVAELAARLFAPPTLGAAVVTFEQGAVDTVEPVETLPAGTRYDVADVEVCLSTGGLVPSVSYTEFVLQYADGTEVIASLEPLLRDDFFSSVAGGSCARGVVVFRSAEAAQPTAIVLRTNAFEPAPKPVSLTWTLG
jgi:hypothetical protein